MMSHVVNLPTNFEDPMPILDLRLMTFSIYYHWQCICSHYACAVSHDLTAGIHDLTAGIKRSPRIRNPWD